MTDNLVNAEADITFCKNAKQRGENKIKIEILRTKFNFWSMMKNATIGAEEAIAQLEFVKTDFKEQVSYF